MDKICLFRYDFVPLPMLRIRGDVRTTPERKARGQADVLMR